MSLQQPQIKGIGPTTLGNPFSQFVAPTAPEPVVPNITPRKPPADISQGATMAPMPVIKPKLPQGIPEPKLQPTYANDPFADKKSGVTRDQFGQTQPKPGTLGAFDPSNFIKDIGSTGKSFKGTMNEVKDFAQNKAPGLEVAKQEGRFLTQDHLTNKITTAIQSMPDATDEEIAQAIGQLKNEGYIFEGMNDRNFDNPVTNFLGNTPLGAGADLMGGVAGMIGNFVGGTLEGGAEMSEGIADVMGGDTNTGMSKIVGGGTNYGLNILGGAFPGVSSLFNTEAVKPVTENTLEPLHEGIQKNIVNKGLDLTGMDPNSEEYQRYSRALSDVGTLLTTLGIAKTGEIAFRETFGTDLNYNNTTVKDFVKNTGKTAEDLQNAIKQTKPDFNVNIKDNTPISKIFTPEEYAQVRAIAENNGATGVGRREGIISDATQAKVKEKVTNGFKMAEKRAKEPTPISDENAINSQGIKGTVPEPTVLTNIKDKVFGDSKDIDLANRAVSPRNVKGKTMTDKMQGGKVALSGLQQLHDDSIAGNITADIGTLEGGIAGIEEARQYHGKIIGENANPDQKVAVSDIGQTLKDELQNPIMVISGPIKGIGNDLVQMLEHPSYQDGVNMKDVQTTLSTISNRIRNSPELRNSLQSEPAGQAVSAFIDELSARYEKAIEEGGNGPADKEARIAYAKIKKIQDDLLNSGMVNARNTRTGQSGFVGKSIATYELLTHGVAGIPVALAMKYLGETKGEYATRGGAYAKLIRNMDRKALQRTKGVYNNGDTSKYTPPAPKTPKPTPKQKKDAGNTMNSNSVPTDTVDMAGAKVTPKSDIHGSRRTKIEVPGNPKGNITNRLSGDKGVILGPQKQLGDGKIVPKQLMAPKNPKGTITPRSDIVAESMRNTNSKRPDITPKTEGNIPTERIKKRFSNSEDVVKNITSKDGIVWHSTSKDSVSNIEKNGFKTGRDLGLGEKRGAVYFADKEINGDIYFRNTEGSLNAKKEGGEVGVDISKLKLFDGTATKELYDKYNNDIQSGNFSLLPKGYDGYISYMGKNDSRVYQIALPAKIANENMVKVSDFIKKAKKTDITPKPDIKPKKEYASALEAMNSPEYKARIEKINENKPKKVTKTSNNLYHTTKAENIDSIMKEGLVAGKKARYEGVSSPSKISFSANEKGASYYGGPNDLMIRTKTSYKPDDLDTDHLAGGEGTYTTGKNIPPEMLQVKVKGKWIDLVDYGKIKPKTDITPKITPKNENKELYHGGKVKFTEFDDNKIGSTDDYFGKGYYLTDSLDSATSYGKEISKFNLKDANIFNLANPTKAEKAIISEFYDSSKGWLKSKDEVLNNPDKAFQYGSRQELADYLKAKGYDGISFGATATTDKSALDYVIFDKKKISSKTDITPKITPKKDIKVNDDFNKDDFFMGNQKGKNYQEYQRTKYDGISKATGLDSIGIGDKAIEWYDKWIHADIITPPIEAIKEFGSYKSQKPIDIYWGGSNDEFSLSRNKPQSFTTDLNVAREFGDAGRRDNPVIIKVSSVQPKDVAIDLGNIPKQIEKLLRGFDEKEVITSINMDKLSGKYTVSASKDGGKTWKILNPEKIIKPRK